jgi:hypothetical protein
MDIATGSPSGETPSFIGQQGGDKEPTYLDEAKASGEASKLDGHYNLSGPHNLYCGKKPTQMSSDSPVSGLLHLYDSTKIQDLLSKYQTLSEHFEYFAARSVA